MSITTLKGPFKLTAIDANGVEGPIGYAGAGPRVERIPPVSFSAKITDVDQKFFDKLFANVEAERKLIETLPEFRAIAERIEAALRAEINAGTVSVKRVTEAVQRAAGCAVTIEADESRAVRIGVPWPPVTT